LILNLSIVPNLEEYICEMAVGNARKEEVLGSHEGTLAAAERQRVADGAEGDGA
jgi:hypothetical protein